MPLNNCKICGKQPQLYVDDTTNSLFWYACECGNKSCDILEPSEALSEETKQRLINDWNSNN